MDTLIRRTSMDRTAYLEKSSNQYPGWGLDGQVLHEQVDPSNWCVTLDDLKFVRREIRQAVQVKILVPTTLDLFRADDDKCGPNMYTVVKDYIKPLTQLAGGMSWALARHPAGLTGKTIFITHCWAEGAYEFVDKVCSSWPRGHTMAWCCVFANPQCLDVGHLLRKPSESPFARALRRSSIVMAVANYRVSPHTRIWCIYEAYLAMSWGKPVFFATPPRPISQRYIFGLSFCMAASSFPIWLMERCLPDILIMFQWGLILFKLLQNFSIAGYCCCIYVCERRGVEDERDLSMLEFCAVGDAVASVPSDKDMILGEIGGKACDVENMINILRATGIFSTKMEGIRRRGVKFAGIAIPQVPGSLALAFALSPRFLLAETTHIVETVLTEVSLLGTLILAYRADLADKAWIHAMVGKAVVLFTIMQLLCWVYFEKPTLVSEPPLLRRAFAALSISVFLVSSIGMDHLSRFPLGPTFVQFFGPGNWFEFCRKFQNDEVPTSDREQRTIENEAETAPSMCDNMPDTEVELAHANIEPFA